MGGLADGVAEIEAFQHLDRVGRHVDGGADAAESGCLFEDPDLDADPAKRDRRRESTDACSNDGDHGVVRSEHHCD